MMSKPWSITAIFLAITAISGQPLPIKVVDIENLQPIPGVYLYDNEGGIDSTDAEGRVRVQELKDESVVLFKHRLYKTKQITYGALLKGKTVKMAKDEDATEESIVTVNRYSEKKEAVPGRVLTLNKQDFWLYNPQSVADLLASSDAIYFPKSLPGSGTPMIRGFAGNSLLLQVDGVRTGSITGKSDHLQNIMSLDPNVVESAEVLFGPGSAVHGGDAMGGVLNFHFREPALSADSVLKTNGMVIGRFASANGEKNGSANFSIGTKKLGSFTAVTFSDFGDLRMGRKGAGAYEAFSYNRNFLVREQIRVDSAGTVIDTMVENADSAVQKYSGYRQISALEKIRFAASEKVTLGGAVYFSQTGSVPVYDKLIERLNGLAEPEFRYSEWSYGPQRWLLGTVTLDYVNNLPIFNTAKVTIAYQNDNETCHLRKFGDNGLTDSTETVDVLSGNIDCSKQIGKHSVFSYGIESVAGTVSSTAGKKDVVTGKTGYSGTRYPDGFNDYASGGGYGYVRTTWNPIVTSVAGARYSRIFLHSLQTDALYKSPEKEIKINTGIPSGSLGIIVRPLDIWRISLNGSTGFRAPNIDDMSRIFTPVSGYIRVPNSGLQPEYAYSVDLGNEIAFRKIFRLEAVLYATFVENLMVEDDVTYNGQETILFEGVPYRVRSLVNKGTANIGGGSIDLEVRFFDGLALKNTVSFTAGQAFVGSDTIPLYSAPPLFGGSHLLFKFDRIKGDLFVRFNGKKTEGTGLFDMAVNDQNKPFLYPTDAEGAHFSPSWYTVNLATTTVISRYLSCNVAVENIFDKCYRQYAGGIVAPGRNIIFSLRGTF